MIPSWCALALRLACFVVCAGFLINGDVRSAGVASGPAGVLQGVATLTSSQLADLDRGEIVARVVETSDPAEILSFAITRIRTTSSRARERFRNVERWRRAPWVLQLGRLGRMPADRDIEALSLGPGDVRDLARCRVDDCDVRLAADTIEQFRRDVDWSSAGHDARANALFRKTLSAYASSYLARGNAALFHYANNGLRVSIAEGLQELLRRTPFLAAAAPDLHAYLGRFPEGRPVDAEDLIWWAKEKYSRLDVVSLNHTTVIDRDTPSGRFVMAVTKQLYATHFYSASLCLTVYLEDPAGSGYLINLYRVEADAPDGFNWLERFLIDRLVRNRMTAQLTYLREDLGTP